MTTSRIANAAPKAKRPPNVILINIDNHDKWSLGYFGNKFIETPNIDKLFEGGIRFSNFHTASRCTCSRTALMTGRYHARNGAMGTGGAWGQSREDLTTIAHVFAKGGYLTAMFGKWHIGDTYPLRPEDRGFQEVVSCENGSTLSHMVAKKGYTDSPRTAAAFRLNHNGAYEVYEGFRTDIWFRELNNYLAGKRDQSKPFFVYLATVTAHGPHYGPEDLRDKFKAKYEKDEWSSLRRKFAAAVEKKRKTGKAAKVGAYPYDHAADIASLDRNIGRLMDQLRKLDLLENTIVVYMSDGSGSGPASVERSNRFGRSSNPAAFYFPAWGKDKVVKELTANIDILPTLSEICGIKLSDDYKASIDGQSFASLVGVDCAAPWRDRVYIADHQSSGGKKDIGKQMVFRPYDVSTVYLPGGKTVKFAAQKCTSKEPPEVIAKARKAYDQWLKRVLADLPLGAFARVHPSRPVFLEGYPITDGPAGSGVMSYFLLDIDADGRFEFDTNTSDQYGKRKERSDKKTTGTLTLCRKTVKGRLPVAFDKTLKGYRVLPRTLAASFSKETQDITLPSTLSLKKGRYMFNIKPKKGRALQAIRVEMKH
jgi:arylsulfatase A-like enzyme